MSDEQPAKVTPSQNSDKELWRETPDDYYSPSIHVTQAGGIGMNVGGTVYVKPIRAWVALEQAHAEAIRECDLAVAHDRQPYPTAEAYEKVCAALHKVEAERDALRAELAELKAESNKAKRHLNETV